MNEFDFVKNKKILITGASGFIGYYLSELCYKNGALLYGVDINVPKNKNIWIDFKVMNLSDGIISDLMRNNKFDFVYHLAGSASVSISFESPFTDFNSLIPPTLNLIQNIKKFCPSSRLIVFSSAAVYGNPLKLPIKEKDTKKPISPYGIHKLVNENLLEYYSNLYNLDCCVIRIFSAYGEGLKKQLFWDIMNKYKNNKKIIEVYGTGNESRDFIHVKDVVRSALIISKAKLNLNFNVFNVANGKEYSIKEVLTWLFANSKTKPNIIFQGQIKEGDPINWRADIHKLQSLGYKSLYNIKDELKNYYNWFCQLND